MIPRMKNFHKAWLSTSLGLSLALLVAIYGAFLLVAQPLGAGVIAPADAAGLLQRVDAVVSHGGHNTVCESLAAGRARATASPSSPPNAANASTTALHDSTEAAQFRADQPAGAIRAAAE